MVSEYNSYGEVQVVIPEQNLAFCLAVSHLPLSLCGTKRLAGKESRENVESRRGAGLIRVFSMLFVAALVSLLL